MNQLMTGKFISQKRKEKNLTQEQLAEKSVRTYDEEQIMDLLKRTQDLEQQKNILYSMMLMVMGIAMYALSYMVSGSPFRDFLSGFMLGMAIVMMMVGTITVIINYIKWFLYQKNNSGRIRDSFSLFHS